MHRPRLCRQPGRGVTVSPRLEPRQELHRVRQVVVAGRADGTVDSYRQENAICPEWSDLNQLTRCTLKAGAHVVIGPGAECGLHVADL